MTKQKQAALTDNPINTLELTIGRVKNDLFRILVSAVLSIASGLAIGSLINI